MSDRVARECSDCYLKRRKASGDDRYHFGYRTERHIMDDQQPCRDCGKLTWMQSGPRDYR